MHGDSFAFDITINLCFPGMSRHPTDNKVQTIKYLKLVYTVAPHKLYSGVIRCIFNEIIVDIVVLKGRKADGIDICRAYLLA